MFKVIKSFMGCKDGELNGTEFAIGDTVEGELGEIAVREGWAEAEADGSKSKQPEANKAQKNAPENK